MRSVTLPSLSLVFALFIYGGEKNDGTVDKMASVEIALPPRMKATKVVWGAMNEKLIVSYADGSLRTFDPYDATELGYAQARIPALQRSGRWACTRVV